MQFVRIPEERVRVLIGEAGSTKKAIENRTKCRISLAEGEVSVEGEALDEWVAKDVIHAIGRGFNPEKAMFLLKDGFILDFIELAEYANTPKARERIKGRIIGEDGRTRKFIEKNAGAMVSVYGKTVAFIGPFDSVALAKEAVTMLCTGSRHAGVYRFIEKKGPHKRWA
ncbi:MAG: KH domain-containing protein [Candidatus Altiarchaeota archaeon]